MRRSDLTHLPQFIILLCLLLTGAGLVLYLNTQKTLQIAAIILMSLSYLTWGIIHHLKNKDFHLEVLLEYLSLAILGSSLLIILVLRA